MRLEELQQVLQDGTHAARLLALHVQHNVCGAAKGGQGQGQGGRLTNSQDRSMGSDGQWR